MNLIASWIRSPISDPKAKGVIYGLTLDTSEQQLSILYLATVQAIAYGTRHIVEHCNSHGHKVWWTDLFFFSSLPRQIGLATCQCYISYLVLFVSMPLCDFSFEGFFNYSISVILHSLSPLYGGCSFLLWAGVFCMPYFFSMKIVIFII